MRHAVQRAIVNTKSKQMLENNTLRIRDGLSSSKERMAQLFDNNGKSTADVQVDACLADYALWKGRAEARIRQERQSKK